MCRECQCANEWQCSIKGYQPEGFCCERCDFYDPTKICTRRFSKPASDEEALGFCVECKRSNVFLVFVDLKTNQGICRNCFSKIGI